MLVTSCWDPIELIVIEGEPHSQPEISEREIDGENGRRGEKPPHPPPPAQIARGDHCSQPTLIHLPPPSQPGP
jgi:hypothetical protein